MSWKNCSPRELPYRLARLRRFLKVGLFTVLLSCLGMAEPTQPKSPVPQDIPRIVGGEPVVAGQYSFVAAILRTEFLESAGAYGAQFCGGTLIAPTWVLTAAHCVSDISAPEQLKVFLGETDLNSDEAEVLDVEKVILHQDFNFSEYSADIALLKLKYASKILPIPFDQSAVAPLVSSGTIATVVGWGAIDPEGTEYPSLMYEAPIPIFDQELCKTVLGGVGVTIADEHLCAGYSQGGVDTCFGDSGGPLLIQGGGSLMVAGITSFGVGGCAQPNRPGVYSRVSNFAEWIQEQMTLSLYFAQFGTGAGLTSDVVITNVSSSATADVEVQFKSPEGLLLDAAEFLQDPETVFGDGSVRLVVPPTGTVTLGTVNAAELLTGSVTVRSSIDLSGVIRFRLPIRPEAGAAVAGVGSAQPASRLITPVRRSGALSTGVAVQNVGSEEVLVRLTLLDSAGQSVQGGEASEILPPMGRFAKFIQALFPTVDTSSFSGTLIVDAGEGKVAVVALELGSGAGEFTTLPVSEVK